MSDGLSPYAVTEAVSQGRIFPEPPHSYRSDFERDRDRIIHCSAFRRLEGKTQVFSPGINDYYRSRLTHTIEVAQIGRTIAKVLGLNESLTEAICLAHDLGHPPFGHTGEDVLNELMADCGGFEHNAQTLRIVTLLEHPYPEFMGLNLMYETRLGLARKSIAAAKRKRGDYQLRIADCGLRIPASAVRNSAIRSRAQLHARRPGGGRGRPHRLQLPRSRRRHAGPADQRQSDAGIWTSTPRRRIASGSSTSPIGRSAGPAWPRPSSTTSSAIASPPAARTSSERASRPPARRAPGPRT